MKKLNFFFVVSLLFTSVGQIFAQSASLDPNFIQFPKLNAAPTCAAADKGKQYFNTTDNKMYFCNGSAWVDFSAGSLTLPYFGSTNISGISVQILQQGTGLAGDFSITNSSNSNSVLNVSTNGSGYAGSFISSNNILPKALKTQGIIQFAGINEGENKALISNSDGNAFWEGSFGFFARSSANLTITNNVETSIGFNVEDYDSKNSFSTNRFTAPTVGLYHFDTAIDWTSAFAATRVYLQIRQNDSGGNVKRVSTQFTESSGAEPHLSCSATFYLLLNETVEVRVYQNSGGNKQLESSLSTYFSGYLVR